MKNSKFSPLLKFLSFRFLHPTGAAIALHLAVVLPLAWRLNIWLDEAWTMKTTGNGVFYAWREAIATEHQAPLYFAFLAAWRTLHDSLFFTRIFSIMCTTATIALLPALLKRFAPQSLEKRNVLPLMLPLAVAIHPYTIWASLEARVYALVVLLSALLLLFWFDGYAASKTSRRARWFYVALAVVSLYTNYYLGFLLFAGACALFSLKKWKTLKAYIWQMMLVGLFFLPFVTNIKQQFVVNADYYREQTSFAEGVKAVWGIFNRFLLPSAEWETTAMLRVWTARLATIALLFFVVKNLRRIPSMTIALGIFVFVTCAFLMTAYFLLGSIYIESRHCAPLFMPLLLMFTALLTDSIRNNRGFYVWLVLLLIFMPTRIFSDYSPPIKNGDWDRVAEYIETNEGDNQVITTFQLQDALPLAYAYHGKNEILPENTIGDWRPQGAPLTAARWQKQIELLISQIPVGQKQLWLITDSACNNEKTAIECFPLENFLTANYTVEKSENFSTRHVRLLRHRDYGGMP